MKILSLTTTSVNIEGKCILFKGFIFEIIERYKCLCEAEILPFPNLIRVAIYTAAIRATFIFLILICGSLTFFSYLQIKKYARISIYYTILYLRYLTAIVVVLFMMRCVVIWRYSYVNAKLVLTSLLYEQNSIIHMNISSNKWCILLAFFRSEKNSIWLYLIWWIWEILVLPWCMGSKIITTIGSIKNTTI